MTAILEFLTSFYWLLLPQTILESLWYAEWRKAYQRSGWLGTLWEFCRSCFGFNMWAFAIPLYGAWSGRDVEKLLAQYDIPAWGWTYIDGTAIFHVRRSQAKWAEEILLWAGVPLVGYIWE